MLGRDTVASAALLLFAVAAAVESLRLLPYGVVRNPGPGFFPWWISLTLAVLSLVLLGRGLRARAGRARAREARWTKVIGLLLALAAYALVLDRVGYPIATFLLVLFMLRVTEPAPWAVAVVVAGLIAGATYVVFALWLSVPLPPGPFAR